MGWKDASGKRKVIWKALGQKRTQHIQGTWKRSVCWFLQNILVVTRMGPFIFVLPPLFILSECPDCSGDLSCHRAGGWREAKEIARKKSTGKMQTIIVQSQSTWLHCQVLHRHESYQHGILARALDFKDGPLTDHLFLASALGHFSHHFLSINLQASKGEVRCTRSPSCQQAAGPILVQNWPQP